MSTRTGPMRRVTSAGPSGAVAGTRWQASRRSAAPRAMPEGAPQRKPRRVSDDSMGSIVARGREGYKLCEAADDGEREGHDGPDEFEGALDGDAKQPARQQEIG